jgi:hypothetical protein
VLLNSRQTYDLSFRMSGSHVSSGPLISSMLLSVGVPSGQPCRVPYCLSGVPACEGIGGGGRGADPASGVDTPLEWPAGFGGGAGGVPNGDDMLRRQCGECSALGL